LEGAHDYSEGTIFENTGEGGPYGPLDRTGRPSPLLLPNATPLLVMCIFDVLLRSVVFCFRKKRYTIHPVHSGSILKSMPFIFIIFSFNSSLPAPRTILSNILV